LILDAAKKTVQRVGSAKLDLGGIAKGYAVEKVDKILKDHGIKEYLVNGGTSSLAFGVAEDGGPFRVRLKYTGDDETSLRYYVKKAFTSTSAVYEQYRVVDGVTYSHVINTVTGIPVTDYSMAFLEGEDSTRLDAYSTACMIAGIDKTKDWEKAYNFKAALFEDKDGLAELVYENSQLNKA
jgi:thiamine biosynthesis lipoprotein